ncbi:MULTISPECIES: hypothetical protein [Dactylosporangium]|uniref:Uncharacterized protein n=2 Tax=Dactylosporangium TaxID=35753 RepID=A0A9W6KT93_9ACTN|nr:MULTISPECIES: hypothetical protein [Dactylosporangium]UAC00884.1 hypothetical protein Dvina_24215 [Dactylosporangium vinaceum]UWZ48461.1 hypothetical protein Dmats_19845 [Dactylosporangium matsuzakiense]GLL06274.1 hypothetical protein GCM10017581_080230 [Dactylosporangium matsuzakiense]
MPEQRPTRFAVEFNRVYRADGPGHLLVWFAGGRTGRVTILAGPADPPEEFAGEVTAEAPSSCSAAIRAGEFWTLQCNRQDGGGFKALYTPL